MRTLRLFTGVPAALVISLILINANLAKADVVPISSNFRPDPLVVSGTSGGNRESNCGNISAQPNQVLKITEVLPYLRLTVQSAGKPTLLIYGPGGRFCVLADNYSGGKPEISGFWQPGDYSLYIGDLSKGQHNYTLSISQQKPTKEIK